MLNTAGATFDLVERPWILVYNEDGRVEELPLLDVFRRAHELRSVLGEVPTQTFAIARLLLAILHRAVDGPRSAAEWKALWRDPTLPIADVEEYLNHFRGRFNLLSPATPFYQVAGLRTAKDEYSRLDRLIADVPVNSYFFTTRIGSGIDRLSFAEAARWVVHCQTFDPSGIKSGAVDDDRVKNGKGYPIGTGWAGALGGVMVEGRTLRETLLLNLIPRPDNDADRPVWERDPQGPQPEHEDGYFPAGPMELFTWQSRRLRLFHDQDGVHGVLIANGDKMAQQNRHAIEPMSVWRRSSNQEKSSGVVPTYMPRTHEPERAIWRGLAALLEGNGIHAQGKDAPSSLRPAVLDWVDKTRETGILDEDYHVLTRTIGMQYGSQSATTTEVVDDAVSLSIMLLGDAGRELRATAIDAVKDAEAGAQALGNLAANLTEAAGGDGTGARDRAREVVYASLDGPFRSWLSGLGPRTSPTEARSAWQATALDVIRRLGREHVEQAGPVAWRGREVRERHVSTPEADNWFRLQLRRQFTYAYPTETAEVPA